MEKELIKIENRNGQQMVSGRELHDFLQVGKTFGAWIKERITKYNFIENADFTIFWSDSKSGNAVEFKKSPQFMSAKGYTVDYVLTIDMAKELSMLENNERGRQARRYFIECEKKLRTVIKTPQTYLEALKALVASEEEKEKLLLENSEHKKEIERMKPKEIFADSVSDSEKTILIRQLAKLLRQNGVDVGEKKLYAWLRENGYVISKKGGDYNHPTQKSVNMGILTLEEKVSNFSGAKRIFLTTKVTGKGQIYFINKLKEEFLSA